MYSWGEEGQITLTEYQLHAGYFMCSVLFKALSSEKGKYQGCPTLHLRNLLLEMLNNMANVPQMSNYEARTQTGVV